MDLRQQFNQIVDALEKAKQDNAAERQLLAEKAVGITAQQESIFVEQKKVDEARKKLGELEDIIAQKNTNTQKSEELKSIEVDLKGENIALKKKENELYTIKQSQDEREEALVKRGVELSVREREYKTQIKDEFMKEIQFKVGA